MLNAPVWNLWLCKMVAEAGSLSDSSSGGVLSSSRRSLSRKSSGVSVLLVGKLGFYTLERDEEMRSEVVEGMSSTAITGLHSSTRFKSPLIKH